MDIGEFVVVSDENAVDTDDLNFKDIKTAIEESSDGQKADLQPECERNVTEQDSDDEFTGDNILDNEIADDKVEPAVDCLIFPCTFCDIKFATTGQLTRHYKTEHPDKKPTWTCDECDKNFRYFD